MGLEREKTLAALLLTTAGIQVQAAWECKMPNGLTVYRQLSECPADSVEKKSIDQVPEQLPNKPPPTKPPPQKTPELTFTPIPGTRITNADAAKAPAPPGKPTQNTQPTEIDYAGAVCVKLKLMGATQCDTDYNIFSASKVTATIPANTKTAQLVCLGIANESKSQRLFHSHWVLELNNPYSVRPIATCRL